jgi:hypothetical protein
VVDDLFEEQWRCHGKGSQDDYQGNEDGNRDPVGRREPQDASNHTLAELMLGDIGILRHAPHHHVHRHGLSSRAENARRSQAIPRPRSPAAL